MEINSINFAIVSFVKCSIMSKKKLFTMKCSYEIGKTFDCRKKNQACNMQNEVWEASSMFISSDWEFLSGRDKVLVKNFIVLLKSSSVENRLKNCESFSVNFRRISVTNRRKMFCSTCCTIDPVKWEKSPCFRIIKWSKSS